MTEIERLAPSALSPYARNARTHSKRQIRQIARSIERFGWTNPVLIDADNRIIAGHGRVEAAKLLSMAEVPCLRITHLSDAEVRAYVLADNVLAEKAGWDKDLRAKELQGLIDLGFDVTFTGYEVAEVDFMVAEHQEKMRDEADAPLEPQSHVVTQLGEIWRLGDHQLMCGDARDRNTYLSLMADEVAELVFTDPPYNVPIDGFVGGKGKIKHREFAVASGEMSSAQFIDFLETTLGLAAQHAADGSIHYVCMDWRHMSEMLAAGARVYGDPKNLIVWVKDNAGMGTFYRSQHELVFVFKKGEGAHVNNFELGQFGRSRSNVWKYAGVNSMKVGRLEELSMHPTVKPLDMVADAIKDCSRPKSVILDPFGGSGTTLIAAEKTGRRARVIEIDPRYCDVIIRRWERYTGRRATLGDSRCTFEEIEAAFGIAS